MKVLLKTDRVSAAGIQVEGDVIEVSLDEGRRLIQSNQAEPFESAMISPAENAALPRPKPRKKSHA